MALTLKVAELQMPHQGNKKYKLYWLCQAIRWMGIIFVSWVTIESIRFWTNMPLVASGLGRYLKADLSSLQTWQPYAVMTLYLASHIFLAGAIYCIWRMTDNLMTDGFHNKQAARWLMRCGQLSLISSALPLLIRPLSSYILTMYLPETFHRFAWRFDMNDLLYLMFSLSIIAFAMAFMWAAEIAEENRGFI